MGKVARFERRLQGMVGDAFARVFGGSVVPQEVAQGLQREAEDSARPLAGGRVLAPNRYTVTLGAADHDRLAGDEQRVIRLLQDCIREHIDEQGWDTYGEVVVNLERSGTLHTGQFRTSSSVDPDASRQVVAQPRTAGDGAMSQQPGQYPPEDDRRGKYGQQGGYGYDQGQGSYSADQNYGQQYGYDSNQAHGQHGPGQGYNQNYGDPNYGGPQGGYDQGYGYDTNYAHGPQQAPQQAPEQNYGQQYGYDQGRGYDQGYGQGGYGYDSSYGQGQQAPGQGYDQNYGQYGGAHPGYGYDQGPGVNYGEPNYGIPHPGYPADPGAQGYAPPAVQTGPRQLAASLMLDDGSNRSYQLTEGSNVVGRGQDAQFRLPDTGVSRR
ncbi:MAG: FhaA domain-containing protein, partial [Pseudonocardiaceae bacterium]